MEEVKLMYQKDQDLLTSKKHLGHVYRAESENLLESIILEIEELQVSLAGNDTKLEVFENLHSLDTAYYNDLKEKMDESLDHVIESNLETEVLAEKFSTYWSAVAKLLQNNYEELADDQILAKSEKEDILSALANASVKIYFLAGKMERFLEESSNKRMEKLQSAFTASTFTQMNGYFKSSPWSSLKDFKYSFIKKEVDTLFDKYFAALEDLKRESEEEYIEGQMELANTEEIQILTQAVKDNGYESIIAAWNECVDLDFVTNEASAQLKAKFPKIAEETVEKKVKKFLESYIDEKLAEANYLK